MVILVRMLLGSEDERLITTLATVDLNNPKRRGRSAACSYDKACKFRLSKELWGTSIFVLGNGLDLGQPHSCSADDSKRKHLRWKVCLQHHLLGAVGA